MATTAVHDSEAFGEIYERAIAALLHLESLAPLDECKVHGKPVVGFWLAKQQPTLPADEQD